VKPIDAVLFIHSVQTEGLASALQKSNQWQKWFFVQGARAGTNFYLRILEGSDTPGKPTLRINGRAGSTGYEFTGNAIEYAFGSNTMTAVIGSQFTYLRQYLDMGLGEVEPGSVVWTGNQFSALTRDGATRFGEFEVSNGLPCLLKVRLAKDSPPMTAIGYKYPTPPNSFGGFPCQMTFYDPTENGFTQLDEVAFYSIRIASKPLPPEFFNPDQFKTAEIIYTNTYSDDLIYGSVRGRGGQLYTVIYTNGPKGPVTLFRIPK
jgi:hypothetical protein